MATLPRDSRSERTRQIVVRLLRERGTLSRADIARATGLSRSTISGLISELVADDIVMELGTKLPPVGGRAGRPAAAVMLNPATGEVIGVDFGHRHVHVIIADVAHEVRIARSAELPPRYEPHQGLHAAAELVQAAMAEIGTRRSRILGVGVSLPCTVDRHTGLPVARRYSPWSGVPVALELGERLRMPVLVDNDANLGALAERQWGAGRDHQDLVYLKLHAGVSAAFISNGQLVRGPRDGGGDQPPGDGPGRPALPLRPPRLPGVLCRAARGDARPGARLRRPGDPAEHHHHGLAGRPRLPAGPGRGRDDGRTGRRDALRSAEPGVRDRRRRAGGGASWCSARCGRRSPRRIRTLPAGPGRAAPRSPPPRSAPRPAPWARSPWSSARPRARP
ncbi:ROK family transcriptional regulator [Streptacidiphilus sp. 4-A2]|nr:ROK family transcriptional regulator [Streptacidiphilus sp. 4-A2]